MTPNKVLRMAVAAVAAIGTVHADTDARMSVVATCNPGPNTITFPVADTTGLFDDTYVSPNKTQLTRHEVLTLARPVLSVSPFEAEISVRGPQRTI
jgi:hypothetical protein